jgi:phenylpyruvate tautomerase PptA (4-oxalocrotonate tautomerase family)
MPIYQCISPEGLLDESQRENIAGEITRIHCDATGAPRSFVNVVFQDMPNGRVFTGASRSTHSNSVRRHPRRPGCRDTAGDASRFVANVDTAH